MKESIGYTVTLNIAIMFIVIVFGLIAMALSYYKAYKVGNVITHAIEKYEGYNELSQKEIDDKLSLLGYNKAMNKTCTSESLSDGREGYCVYLEIDSYKKDEEGNYIMDKDGNIEVEYGHYKIETNMLWNIPLINNILEINVENNTKKIYGFENVELFDCNSCLAEGNYCSYSDPEYPDGVCLVGREVCESEGKMYVENLGETYNDRCITAEDYCLVSGGYLIGNFCDYSYFNNVRDCEFSGGYWTGDSCYYINEEEINCFYSGGNWTGSSCIYCGYEEHWDSSGGYCYNQTEREWCGTHGDNGQWKVEDGKGYCYRPNSCSYGYYYSYMYGMCMPY